ncbi:MAG TPA: GWxTD domain-containing protein [Thermoanaerobaculia bacterium]
MKRIAPAAFVLGASLLFPPALPAQSMPELFQKAKQQVKLGAFDQAFQTLAALDAESSKPGNEADRRALEPSLRFYRGVCESALGRDAEAQADFRFFLSQSPRAVIDPALYPKTVVAAFERARREMGSAGPADAPSSSQAPSLRESFERFRPDPLTPAGEAMDDWASGPVRYLLTPEEKKAWEVLSGTADRTAFVTKFWASRDPRPETAQNEFREEFERRVIFADGAFRQGELRGSLTDRGMVFVLIGPPFNVGRRPITAAEDGSDVRNNSLTGSLDTIGKLKDTSEMDTSRNLMETWTYRRESLPPAAPYKEVVFHFITRKGYGVNVLQREPAALTTLEFARRSVRASS